MVLFAPSFLLRLPIKLLRAGTLSLPIETELRFDTETPSKKSMASSGTALFFTSTAHSSSYTTKPRLKMRA
jgi:hypothetical protein